MTAPPGRPHASDMVSGGTFQSMATLTGEENAALALDPAVLIPDEAAAASVRVRSPIGLAPRRGGDGAVIAPMAPAPYINPGVIHRSALLRAQARSETFEPFRYREGIAISGRPLTLPRTVVRRGCDRGHDGGPQRARAIRTGGAPAGRGDDGAAGAELGVRSDRLATGALALAHDGQRADTRQDASCTPSSTPTAIPGIWPPPGCSARRGSCSRRMAPPRRSAAA